jgi:hypothetical protein
MTPEQKEGFHHSGCASRCLLMIAKWSPNPITVDEFFERYSSKYPHWETTGKWGGTETSDVLDIARKLGLANNFQIYLDPKEAYKRMKMRGTRIAMLFTEKRLKDDGSYGIEFHASLINIECSTEEAFWVLQVADDITISAQQPLSRSEICEVGGYFALFS